MLQEAQSQTIGNYYKGIREERGYSLGDVARSNDNLSKSQISRFESGLSMLTTDRFLLAIKAINMTPNEFFALWAEEPNQYQSFGNKIMAYEITKDIVGLKKLIKGNAKLKRDKFFNISTKAVILDLTGKNLLTKVEQTFLNRHFNMISQWTMFDISIFNRCLALLDEEEVYDLGQDMLDSEELSVLFIQNSDGVKKTAINLYIFLISKGWYRRAERIKEILDDFITEWDLEEKISLHIFKKVSRYKQKNNPELLIDIQDDIDRLRKFGAVGIAERFEKILNLIINA